MSTGYTMPWGKFRGRLLTEIDSSYLCWALESADALSPELRVAIFAELRTRFGSAPPSSPCRSKPCPDPILAADLVSAGLKQLAKTHHPDHGGDTRTMQTISAVADWLKQVAS